MKKNKKTVRVVLWVLIVFMVVSVVLPALAFFRSSAYAQGYDFTISATTTLLEKGKDETKLNFKIKNNTGSKKEKVQIKIVDAENTTALSGSSDSMTILASETRTFSIPISTYNIDSGWEYWYKVKVYVNGQEVTNNSFSSSKISSSTEGKYTVAVYEGDKKEDDFKPGDGDNAKQYNGKIRLSLEIPQGGVTVGNNKVSIKAKNLGNSALQDMRIGFTGLPDGVTLPNQAIRKSVDTATINVEKTATYYFDVKDDVKTGNYPITLFAEGKLPNGSIFSTEETVYLHITGSQKEKQRGDISIRNVRLPEKAKAGESFTLSFDVVNTGNGNLEGLKVSVEGTDGIVNKSKGIFIEDTLLAKQSKKYSVTFFSNSKTEPKNYPIKIAVEPLETKEGEGTIATSQYAGIFIYGGGENADKQTDGVKNPQIMIEDYAYGGNDVQAGQEFVLHLTLANTSQKTLRNIKVSLSADEGTFVPVNSSSSFFIDSMGSKSRIKKAMRFVAKPTAEQKTSAISVDYSYEDLQGNVLTAKDTISIPVVQKTKLDIGEVNIPTEGVFEGQQANFSVTFYNFGKTVLSNLNVKATGDFTLEDKNGYFVGNMEAGKSDSFDFAIVPDKVGTVDGEIIFSYEDVSGTMQEVRKPFQFEVSEFIPPEDPANIPEDNQDTNKGKKIAGVSALVVLLAGAVIWKKKKNRSKAKELEIDE